MAKQARNLVRFPGSGGAEHVRNQGSKGPRNDQLNDFGADRKPADEGVFLDRQPIWFKLAGAAALLYGAYLLGWSGAEPAQSTAAPPTPNREIALTAPPPTAPVTVVAPATEKPVPLIPPPPPGTRRLSNEELREVQAKLQALGHDPGSVDGLHGPQTVSAVKRYEIANQIEPTGNIDLRLLERLRREP